MSLFDDAKAALEDLKSAAQSVVVTADRIVEHLRGQEDASAPVDPTIPASDAPVQTEPPLPDAPAPTVEPDAPTGDEPADPTAEQSAPLSPETSPIDSAPSAEVADSPADNTEHAQLHG